MPDTITLPTQYGELDFFFRNIEGQECLVALNQNYSETPFLRIHSSCVFSESFHTIDCDCALQLNAALEYISINGGIVIYLYQEGRGIGLNDKVRAIFLEQTKGLNTIEAFNKIGHPPDPRSYQAAIAILKELKISNVVLGTSNPQKEDALTSSNINIEKRINLPIKVNERTRKYISDKVKILGHHEKD